MKKDLVKKIILVTGASSGIGQSVCELLLQKGHTVFATARNVEQMRGLASKGGQVREMDVTEETSVSSCVRDVIRKCGQIDVLVNNAGYGSYGAIESVPMEEVGRQYEVNLFGYGRLIQSVLPHMRARRSGLIINVSSVAAHASTAGMGWYASTKHAVDAMSDALRMEVHSLGINVVKIEPGMLNTGFEEVAFNSLDSIVHPDDYSRMMKAFRKYFGEMYSKGPKALGTARTIVRAIDSRRPKAVYRTTFTAKWLPIARRMVSTRMYDRLVLKRFN